MGERFQARRRLRRRLLSLLGIALAPFASFLCGHVSHRKQPPGHTRDNPVEAIGVRWPGAGGETLLRAPSADATLVIRREWSRRR